MTSTFSAGRIGSAAAAAVLLSVAAPGAQSRATFWYAVEGSAAAPLSRFIAEALGGIRGAGTDTEATLNVSETYAELRRRTPADAVFVLGGLKAIQQLIAMDAGHGTLDRLGLETINVRIVGHPFHFFYRADQEGRVRNHSSPLKVGYAALADSLQPPDVRSLLAPLLGTRQLDVEKPIGGPGALARRLASEGPSRLDLVGIYDAEPSTFLRDFVTEYKAVQPKGDAGQLRRAQIYVFPTNKAGFEINQLRLASGGPLSYAFLRYDSQSFHDYKEMAADDPNAGVLTVTPTTAGAVSTDAPLVMTNLRKTRGAEAFDRFTRQLSDAYVSALFQVQTYGSRCSGPSAPVFKSYLFNAHLADRANFAKTLGLYSHLTLMATSPARNREDYTAQARMLDDALGGDLAAALADPRKLIQRLRGQSGTNTRVGFSGDVSSIYPRAKRALEEAARSPTAEARKKKLEEARGLLMDVVATGRMPSCHEGGRAMWSAEDFDPFFHLAFADALTRSGGTR
ncbi:MAG: hypothetical protein WD690_06275 [Vicinamibacterales bacterium]